MELDNDLREPFAGDRAQFIDAANRIDDFLDRLRAYPDNRDVIK